ncbi:hypothetical protein WCQ02_31220 [Paraburkholderia tropica]|uniref:hypothetical protein n=1 Tax=Paraburkholderia tropica TaxID=92647 RepID=UPI0030163EB6
MKYLLEVLAGVGSAMNAFGTLPQYDVPKRGDRCRDFAIIGNDMRRATARVEKQARKAIAGKHGAIHDSAGKE